MYPQTHFLFPFFLALILTKLNYLSWQLALLAGIVGVLVDLDHYVEHILHAKTDKFSLIATWNNSIKLHRFNQRSFIHYGKGVLILTIILIITAIFSWQIALALALGYYSHIFLDDIHLRKEKYFRRKMMNLWFKESYFEIVLDVTLVIGILVCTLI